MESVLRDTWRGESLSPIFGCIPMYRSIRGIIIQGYIFNIDKNQVLYAPNLKRLPPLVVFLLSKGSNDNHNGVPKVYGYHLKCLDSEGEFSGTKCCNLLKVKEFIASLPLSRYNYYRDFVTKDCPYSKYLQSFFT